VGECLVGLSEEDCGIYAYASAWRGGGVEEGDTDVVVLQDAGEEVDE
jgi:predicted nucleotidyltransferase